MNLYLVRTSQLNIQVKKDEEWLIKKAYENGQIHFANEEDEDEFVEMKGYQKREKTIDD